MGPSDHTAYCSPRPPRGRLRARVLHPTGEEDSPLRSGECGSGWAARWGTAGLLSLVLAYPAAAGSLSDEPFSLRLTLALDRGSSFTDVIGLSASTAYPYPSSVNPAGGDFLRTPPNQFTATGTLTGDYIAFNSGASITAGAASAAYRLPKAGTLIVSYTRVDSHDAHSHQDDRFALRADQLRVTYSHRLATRATVGAAINLSESTLGFRSTLMDFPLRTESVSHGIDAIIGAMVGLSEDWLAGASVGLGWARSETTGSLLTPDPPFGFGTLPVRFTDNTRSISARGGLGWRPSDQLGAYLDGQYLKLTTEQIGASDQVADVARVFVGVEALPIMALAVRVGLSIDTDQQTTVSTGIGIYPHKNWQFELAYAYNAFPEVRKEFGRAHLISLSMVGLF